MNKNSFSAVFQLFKRDMVSFWRTYPGKMIDILSFFTTTAIVFGYFMPSGEGMANYGVFIIIGAIASFGLIEIVGKVSLLLADIEGDRTISQSLILPLKSEMLFGYIGCYWALNSTLLSLLLFPLSKILLFHQFDLSKISYLRFIAIYLSGNLFFGFFSLWLTSMLRGIDGVGGLWARVINPMWMFGAYFYSWESAYKVSPLVGYLHFINPMVYIMEGSRAAALGQEGYLPFWFCLVMVWIFIFACAFHAISKLKKRLDCV